MAALQALAALAMSRGARLSDRCTNKADIQLNSLIFVDSGEQFTVTRVLLEAWLTDNANIILSCNFFSLTGSDLSAPGMNELGAQKA